VGEADAIQGMGGDDGCGPGEQALLVASPSQPESPVQPFLLPLSLTLLAQDTARTMFLRYRWYLR
jgi:hypothetical protein